MITHNEVMAVWHGSWVLASLAAGLLVAHWWWPSRERLEDERDEGRGEMIDQAIERVEREGMVFRLSPNGKAVWCDAGSQWDLDGAQRAVAFDDVGEAGQGVAYPVRGAYPAPGTGEQPPPASLADQVRPGGPSPAAGRTYSELVMLAAQDTPGPLDDALTAPVDPGWFPEALRRSEDWLAACRAELGLVAS